MGCSASRRSNGTVNPAPLGSHFFASLVACSLATAYSSGAAQQPPATDQRQLAGQERVDTSLVRAASAVVFCSDTLLRTGVVLLSWQSPAQVTKRQNLQLTVYKRGFDTGLFVGADLSVEIPELQASPASLRSKAAVQAFSGLALARRIPSSDSTAIGFEIKGLRPGATYFWRVLTNQDQQSVTSIAERFQGPTCPADIREGSKEG
jgi:hypothetical protein